MITINNEDIDVIYPESRDIARLMDKDIWFDVFWKGGMFGPEYHLVLKRQLATIEKNGKSITLYNERPYRKPRKGCLPPKFVRIQGRSAKSYPSIANNRPSIRITDKSGKDITLHECTCHGKLVYDQNEYLYCSLCGSIYNDTPIGYLQFASLIHSRGSPDVKYSNWWVEVEDWFDEDYSMRGRADRSIA